MSHAQPYGLGAYYNQHINPEPNQLRHKPRQPSDVTLCRTQHDGLALDVTELAPPRTEHRHDRGGRVDRGRVQVANLMLGA